MMSTLWLTHMKYENSKRRYKIMKIERTITLTEATQLVNNVVEGCFTNGDYNPLNKNVLTYLYAIIYFAPNYYADKKISLEDFYISMDTDEELIGLITDISGNAQYARIESAINEKIAFELEKLKNPLNIELTKAVEKVTDIINKVGSSFDEETIKKIMPALENIGKLTDVKQEDVIKEIVSSLKPSMKTTKKKTTTKSIK